MKNKDLLKEKSTKFAQALRKGLDDKDDVKIAEAFENFSKDVQQIFIDTEAEFRQSSDATILASRGIRQLTSIEQNFYDGIIGAFKSSDPRQALTGVENTFPLTVIDTVLDDVKREHPLLSAINIQTTTGSTKWLYHDGSAPLATWAKLTSAITEEMSASIKNINFDLSKLTAFIPIPKDLLDLGANYLDAYIRVILSEALANGYEYGYIKGTGKDQPIGMIKDLSSNSQGVYSDKAKTKLSSLKPVDYCSAISKLTKRADGTSRVVSEVMLIVNPTDYVNKVVPATTVLATDGTYKGNIFPFPTKVYPSEQLAEGEAVLGIAENYKAFVAGGNVNIDYSDEAQWLEDNRVYKAKVYGYGLPVDNTSFLYLDISKLEPYNFSVKIEGTVETAAKS